MDLLKQVCANKVFWIVKMFGWFRLSMMTADGTHTCLIITQQWHNFHFHFLANSLFCCAHFLLCCHNFSAKVFFIFFLLKFRLLIQPVWPDCIPITKVFCCIFLSFSPPSPKMCFSPPHLLRHAKRNEWAMIPPPVLFRCLPPFHHVANRFVPFHPFFVLFLLLPVVNEWSHDGYKWVSTIRANEKRRRGHIQRSWTLHFRPTTD